MAFEIAVRRLRHPRLEFQWTASDLQAVDVTLAWKYALSQNYCLVMTRRSNELTTVWTAGEACLQTWPRSIDRYKV